MPRSSRGPSRRVAAPTAAGRPLSRRTVLAGTAGVGVAQSRSMASNRAVVDRLREVVGTQVIDDPEVVVSYTTDWTGRFAGHSIAVVRPGSTQEVAGVVAACRELGVSLVPQGGNTGLVGGGVPL